MVQTLFETNFERLTPTAWDSLTQRHTRAILDAAGMIANEWRVDTHEDYEGYLTILVTAQDPDTTESTFILSGRVQHIELAELLGNDDLCHHGYFQTIEAAAVALAAATQHASG